MSFQSFDSFNEMMDAIAASREAADSRIQPWQGQVKPGDFFVQLSPGLGLTIYGEILDPARPNPDEEEAKIYQEPHMLGYRLTRAYSQACPEGEMGDVHVSALWCLIDKEQFERARTLSWPDLLPTVADLAAIGIVVQPDGRVKLDFELVAKGSRG